MSKLKKFLDVSYQQAYWISPRGKIVEVGTTHISMIISHPEVFKLTRDMVDKMYAKYDEPIGLEGKAREELIIGVIKKGWVRIRKYKNNGYSVNISKMTKKNKDILYDWANKLLNTGINGRTDKDLYSPVRIMGMDDNYNNTFTLTDISNDVLYDMNETYDKEVAIEYVQSITECVY